MIHAWIDNHPRVVFYVALVLIFALTGIMAWTHFHPPNPVAFESQEQAATPAGVEKAASAAQVPISTAQAVAIANAIKQDVDKPPDAVVQTTGAKLETTIKTELQRSSGQFAIVTKKVGSTLPPTVGTILPNTTVQLNQYNVEAYPAHLIQVGGSYEELFAAYSWKVNIPKIPLIAPHADVGYFGVYTHANFDQPGMSRIGVMLTIPK